MAKYRKYIPIAGTLACALGVGFFMQQGREVPQGQAPGLEPVAVHAQPIETPSDPPAPALTEPPREQASADEPDTAPWPGAEDRAVEFDRVTLTATTLPTDLPRVLPDLMAPTPAALNETEELAPRSSGQPIPQHDCALIAQATPAEAATVRITAAAPCYPNERITLHHNGMMFTSSTDAAGNLVLDVPALAEHAIFILAFANGKGAVAQAHVPDMAQYDRVALQWSGEGGFQIHAREYGAGYGEQGHVWSGSIHSSLDAELGVGGFAVRLGDLDTLAPQVVEIYSFPTASARRAGKVMLSIEAEVTAENCGRDVSAQVLRLSPGQALETRELTLTVPGCDAMGDFLVLNNLVDDLKIAGK